MNTYSYTKIRTATAISGNNGDFKSLIKRIKNGLYLMDKDQEQIHPKELERLKRMYENRGFAYLNSQPRKKAKSGQFMDSLIIVTGDSGLGFNPFEYYKETLENINEILEYNNSYLVFIRGNHDNPDFFDGKLIDYPRVKAIPDYSVININEKNILCVGGAISIDREWRKKHEAIINMFNKGPKKSLYFENEAPVYNDELLNEIVKSVKIDYVISHSSPSFIYPDEKEGLDSWAENDSSIVKDLQDERLVLDKVFGTLRDNGSRPTYWLYSHFNMGSVTKRSDTLFRSISNIMVVNIDADIAQFNKIESEKKKKNRKKKIVQVDDFGNVAMNDLMDGLNIEAGRVHNGAENAPNPNADLELGEPMFDEEEHAEEARPMPETEVYNGRFEQEINRIRRMQPTQANNSIINNLRDEFARYTIDTAANFFTTLYTANAGATNVNYGETVANE